jgi:lipopolysaccharide transport system ATP-binding protein
MHQRLAFAVAAHLEPEILIVDEVLAVGDMSFQKKCLGKMQDVAETGRTILFVSHNMSAVTGLCARAVLLSQGSVIQIGPSAAVVASYLSEAAGSSAIAEWNGLELSPGIGGFKLASVAIMNENDEPSNVLNIEKAIKLRIIYHVDAPELSFRCAASFHTQGTCAFVTVEIKESRRTGGGWYSSVVEIPGNLLAEGEYTVNLSVFSSRGKKVHLCKLSSVVAFQIFDPLNGVSARGDYTEGLGGVMRPLLYWHSASLEGSAKF